MGNKGVCKIEGCAGDVRGKGYCDRHYRAWRRGKLPKPRYTRCNAAGCTKPAARRSLCLQHFGATHGKAKKAEGAAAGSSAPPPEADEQGTEASA
jgi:hypothetical protein